MRLDIVGALSRHYSSGWGEFIHSASQRPRRCVGCAGEVAQSPSLDHDNESIYCVDAIDITLSSNKIVGFRVVRKNNSEESPVKSQEFVDVLEHRSLL